MPRKPLEAVNLVDDDDEVEPRVEPPAKKQRVTVPETPSTAVHPAGGKKRAPGKTVAARHPPSPTQERESADEVPTGGRQPQPEGSQQEASFFRPSFINFKLDRELLVSDSVLAEPTMGHSLLSAIRLPADVEALPKAKAPLLFDVCGKLALAGQALAQYCDVVSASDKARRKGLEEKTKEITSLKAELGRAEEEKRRLAEALKTMVSTRDQKEKEREAAVQALDEEKARRADDIDKADSKGFEDGKAAAIALYRPQVKEARSKGRAEAMELGFRLGFRQALAAVEVPEPWEVP